MARAKNKERQELEKKLGVSKSQVNRILADSAAPPVENPEGGDVEDFISARNREKIAAANLREEQSKIAALKRAEQERILIPREEVIAHGRKIGAILSAEISACRNNMPGKLAGLDEVGVRAVLDIEFDRLLDGFLTEIAKV